MENRTYFNAWSLMKALSSRQRDLDGDVSVRAAAATRRLRKNRDETLTHASILRSSAALSSAFPRKENTFRCIRFRQFFFNYVEIFTYL